MVGVCLCCSNELGDAKRGAEAAGGGGERLIVSVVGLDISLQFRHTSHVTRYTLHVTRHTCIHCWWFFQNLRSRLKGGRGGQPPTKSRRGGVCGVCGHLLMVPRVRSMLPCSSCKACQGLEFGVWGFGFWVLGVGCWVLGLGFRVWGLGFGVWGVGFGVCLGASAGQVLARVLAVVQDVVVPFRVGGLGFGVWGLGIEVWGVGFEV